jgi:hypothetical protein
MDGFMEKKYLIATRAGEKSILFQNESQSLSLPYQVMNKGKHKLVSRMPAPK